jgi:probable rRNA maturation factor
MPPTVSIHLLKELPEAEDLPSGDAFARVLARAGASGGEVNLILTGAAQVRRLNREFRGKDLATDVLAFDYGEDRGRGRIWGDVFVSAEAARRQARELRLDVLEELARLFLHGCLHLLGHRDTSPGERARMEALQESLLPELLQRSGAGAAPSRPKGRRKRA